MHGHGVNECFWLHPHLRKEKVSTKVMHGNDGHLVEVDNVVPNLMVEGNISNLHDTFENIFPQVIEGPAEKEQDVADKSIQFA
ncbi:hypothetical protein MA16_Dca027971 [Dendrobium catenatum]|uniref:Uncharacterized protein n=1 Tax=Dendrobium catenatum TaxID=906689 RepID=A0A2I0VG87_9ASPA|nr:hypothetical protein MA16_Dca027971 [Dendrobium catenatum]